MSLLSRLARANEGLHRVCPRVSTCRALAVALLMLAGIQAARPAVLAGGRFVEADGWKARITVDCLLKDKLCGSFRYETQACEGDLIFSGETAAGFEFRAELRAGRCLPGCTIQLSGDFTRYAEVCKDSRHEGFLTVAGAPTAAPVGAAPVPRTASEGKKQSGQVHFKWDNGDVFDGQMIEGKRNGKGRIVWANGMSYDGDWRDDVAVGEGVIVFANGDRFQGQVKDGTPDGRGLMQFSNGNTYEGQFSNGLADAEGVYTEKGGSRYTGQWKAGIKNGRGKFVWASGQSYDGDWVADKPEGKGSITFSNGDQYDGQVSNGLPHGKGVKIHTSLQDRYEGNFVQGEVQGEGLYRWKNGDLYTGNWQKGKKSGAGRYRWASGDYWEGEFADDKKTDAGRLYFTPTVVASSAEATKLAQQADAVAGPADVNAANQQAAKGDMQTLDRAKLLAIPMVAKEVRNCSRKQGSDCATRVVNDVLGDTLLPHTWQTVATEKGAKGKGPVFEVDANSVLEGGNVFSWLRSGDGNVARNIGIKYDCRAQTLEIQLVYNCTGSQTCVLDPNIDKYAGRVIPATDIKSWFKDACER
jgi:hypothetical protein